MSYRRGYGESRGHMEWWLSAGVAVIVLGSCAVSASNFTEEEARVVLESQGYRDAEHVDKDVLFVGVKGCADSDIAMHEFVATGQNGVQMEVDVCKGIFKGATVRVGGIVE